VKPRPIHYESPRLREARERGENVGQAEGDPWLALHVVLEPRKPRGKRPRRRVEEVADPRLTGEG